MLGDVTVYAKPMFDAWLDECIAELYRRNEAAMERFGVGRYERWDVMQDVSQLVFSDGKEPKVTADAQLIGSYSSVTDTWKWGWTNGTVLPSFSHEILKVKEYGETHGFSMLTDDGSLTCDEDNAWALAAAAMVVLNGECVYRGPTDKGFVFLLMSNLRRV